MTVGKWNVFFRKLPRDEASTCRSDMLKLLSFRNREHEAHIVVFGWVPATWMVSDGRVGAVRFDLLWGSAVRSEK